MPKKAPKKNPLAPAARITPPAPPERELHARGPEAEWAPIGVLTPWAKNPRKISDRAVDKVAASIKRFGWTNPIIVRKANDMICAGHTRFRAAKKLGMTEVLVRRLDLTEKEARALAIADNRTSEETEWDDDQLAFILRDMQEDGDDLAATGFDDSEVQEFLKKIPNDVPRVPDEDDRVREGGSGDDDDSGDESDEPREESGRSGLGKPVVGYSIVFDDESQQKRWYDFLRKLKTDFPGEATVGARLTRFLESQLDAAA